MKRRSIRSGGAPFLDGEKGNCGAYAGGLSGCDGGTGEEGFEIRIMEKRVFLKPLSIPPKYVIITTNQFAKEETNEQHFS